MKWLLVLLVLYLLFAALICAWVAYVRRGQKRLGPFTTPDGVDFYVIDDDPLADKFGTGDHDTTFMRTVGFANAETVKGADGPILRHEAGEHVERQFMRFGYVGGFLLAPLFVLMSPWPHTSPLEKPAYAAQDAMLALAVDDPKRAPWEKLAAQVNAARAT